MANNLSITIGANTYTEPLGGTNAQANAVILRYLAQKGISTSGKTAAEIASLYLQSLKKYTKDTSADRQRIELAQAQEAAKLAQDAANEAQIAADNAI